MCLTYYYINVAAWLEGTALVWINKVTLHRARLVLGWVTIRGRVNHLRWDGK